MSCSRLSPLDASFLEVESPTAHMHVGWAAALAPPPHRRAPCFTELRDHVGGRLDRAPRYRQRLAEVPLGVSDPVWVDDSDFDIAHHVRRARSGNLRDVADLAMSTPLDRSRPLWELWIADRLEDGRVGLVGKAHHCMVDGLAAVEFATLLLDPSPEPPPPEPDTWRPSDPPGDLQLVAEAATDRVRRTARLARAPLELTRSPGRLLGFLGTAVRAARAARHSFPPAPPSVLNPPISPGRHLARARRPLDEVREIKQRYRASVNDVVLASAAGGVRRFLERRRQDPTPLKAMVPVSLRGGDGAGELGNRISFVFIDLPCDEPRPVARLRRVKSAMGARKEGGEPEGAQAVMDAIEYAPLTVQHAVSHAAASGRAFNLVVSNIPGPRQTLYMRGCQLEEVYPVVPLADRHAVSIGFTTTRDQAFFGVYADRESVPDADELAVAIGDSLDELRATVG